MKQFNIDIEYFIKEKLKKKNLSRKTRSVFKSEKYML